MSAAVFYVNDIVVEQHCHREQRNGFNRYFRRNFNLRNSNFILLGEQSCSWKCGERIRRQRFRRV